MHSNINKVNFIILLLIFTISCSNTKSTANKTTSDTLKKQTSKVDWSKNTFLKLYIDSLSVLTKKRRLPFFLSNDCFDYDNKFYWEPKHKPKSFRKEIIFSISNIEVLEFLLENKDKLSNTKCSRLLEHPYGGNPEKMDSQDYTNTKLVEIRLKQLAEE